MKRFKSILYVSEGSTEQDSAFARAASLAENNQADLTVIEVLPPVHPGLGLAPGAPALSEIQDAMIGERRAALEPLVAPYRSQRDIRVEVVTGKSFLEVIRTVLRDDHDLVVKPAEDPEWTERLFGSDDMHLLRKCPCPVWLMQMPETANYETIVAAVDFDPYQPEQKPEFNRLILELASSLAISDFSTLHIIHVWDAPGEGLLRNWSDHPQESVVEYVRGERARHAEGLDKLHDWLRRELGPEAFDYLSPRLHLSQGAARTVMPQLARQLEADLVVMGTVARTGLPGLLIGNTAEAILDQLRCSVLAVKPPGFASPVRLKTD